MARWTDEELMRMRERSRQEQLSALEYRRRLADAAWHHLPAGQPAPKLAVDPAAPVGDVTVRALYRVTHTGQVVLTDVKRDEPSEYMQERPAIGYRGQSSVRCLVSKQQDADGWECLGGVDCDGSPDDLVPPTRAPKRPIPLRVPARVIAPLPAWVLNRATERLHTKPDIQQVLTFPEDE